MMLARERFLVPDGQRPVARYKHRVLAQSACGTANSNERGLEERRVRVEAKAAAMVCRVSSPTFCGPVNRPA
jgi:hypothetical protein